MYWVKVSFLVLIVALWVWRGRSLCVGKDPEVFEPEGASWQQLNLKKGLLDETSNFSVNFCFESLP